MAILRIQADSLESDYKIRTVLDGVQYLMRIYWNERAGNWFFSIYNDLEQSILIGIPLVANHDLVSRFQDISLPKGIIMLFDQFLDEIEAIRDSLGDRHLLLYEESV